MLSQRVREMMAAGDSYPLASSYESERDVIKMASNENPFGPSPKAVEAVKSEIENLDEYPEPSSWELKEAIGDSLGVNPYQICLGNGSDEIMDLACKAFLDPGDSVLLPIPTFSQYGLAAKANAMNTETVQMDNFRWDVDSLLKAMGGVQMVFLGRPNNPTGRSIDKEELKKLLESGKMVIVDEAYGEFSGDSVVDWIGDYENLLVLKTFSKAYGLAGLRVGYGVGEKRLIKGLELVRPPFSVNRLAQSAACAALDDKEFLGKTLETVHQGREYISEQLKKLGFEVVPSEANFIMASPEPLGTNAPELCEYLSERGILIRDLSGFEGAGQKWVRITVGTRDQNKRLIEVLRKKYGGDNT